MKKKNIHHGSDFRAYLDQKEILAECEAAGAKFFVASQLKERMKKNATSIAQLAKRMHTSRPAVNRLLDTKNKSVTLKTLEKAAHAVNCRLKVELEPLGKHGFVNN